MTGEGEVMEGDTLAARAPCLASKSAISLPWMPACPGTQRIEASLLVRRTARRALAWATRLRWALGCHLPSTIWIAQRLSQKKWVVIGTEVERACSTARMMPSSSAKLLAEIPRGREAE